MTRSGFQISGSVAPGYEPVLEEFRSNFARGRELDAQCCAYVGGRRVVDLWGTVPGKTANPGYGPDSLQYVCSSTKSLAAAAVASLVDRGLAAYSDPVVRSWPEFASSSSPGKACVTLADVLRHESGLANLQGSFRPEALLRENIKRNEVGALIEAEGQVFPPEEFGSPREYHAFSRGLILNEVFRRLDPSGRTIGEWLQEEVMAKRTGP